MQYPSWFILPMQAAREVHVRKVLVEVLAESQILQAARGSSRPKTADQFQKQLKTFEHHFFKAKTADQFLKRLKTIETH